MAAMDPSVLWRAAVAQFATVAALMGIPSALAVLAGVHWLGVTIAVAAFAAWCGWLAWRPEGALWT